MKRYFPLLANILSQCIFGFSLLFIKAGMNAVGRDTVKFLAFRFSLGFIFMTLLLLLGFKKADYRRKPFHLILLCGLLNPMISQILETGSTSYAPTTLIAMMGSIMPIFMLGMSVLVNREYPTRRQLLFCVLSVIGAFITASGQLQAGSTSLFGLFLVLSSQIIIAAGRVFSRRASTQFDSFEIVYATTGIGALEFSIITLAMHGMDGTLPVFFDGLFTNPHFIAAWIFMGIFSCVFAFLLMTYAAGNLPVAVFATTGTMSTVISILVGVFLLHEPFGLTDLIGALIILTGIVGVSLSYDSKKDNTLKGLASQQPQAPK